MKKQLLILAVSLLGVNTFGQVPNYVPSSGLVAFYTFSGSANDVSGNNFNGTVNGATLTTDRFGTANSAYSFVSGNQIVSNPNLPVGNSPRSISLWFQTSSTSYNTTTGIGANVMMSYGSGIGTGGGVGSQLNCETQVGVLNLNHYATSLGGGTNYVSNGQWHHMLYTYNGALHQLYLDGNLIDSDTYALNTGLTSLFFGKRAAEPTWHQYNGKVDDAGIWNRALTLCEIQSLYSGTLPNIAVNAGIDQTICLGSTVTLEATGASSYSWNNSVQNGVSFIPSATTSYTVIGTDANGCIGSDTVSIVVNNNSTSTLNETALDSYTLNGQTYTQSGTYTQVISNAAGCDSTITLNLSLDFTSLNEIQAGFTIAPNPITDVVTISSTDAMYDEYILFEPQGIKVLSGILTGTTTQLDLSKLSRGNYLLQIGEKKTPIKLVKE
jgi:hypothetical protein